MSNEYFANLGSPINGCIWKERGNIAQAIIKYLIYQAHQPCISIEIGICVHQHNNACKMSTKANSKPYFEICDITYRPLNFF